MGAGRLSRIITPIDIIAHVLPSRATVVLLRQASDRQQPKAFINNHPNKYLPMFDSPKIAA